MRYTLNYILKFPQIKIVSFGLILLFAIQYSSAQTPAQIETHLPSLIPYRKAGLWGFCDKNKKIVIPCKYAHVELFDEFGLARVVNDGNMTEYLNVVGLVDTTGKELVPVKYDTYNFTYRVIPYDGGRTDKYGIYDAYKWNDLLIVIMFTGFHDREFDIKIQDVFYTESMNNSSKIPYDRSGNKILDDSLAFVSVYPGVENAEYIIVKNKSDKKFQLFDIKGIRLNQSQFDEIMPFNKEMFIGRSNKKERLYKLNGILVNNLESDQISRINDQMFFSNTMDTRNGIYSLNGDEIVSGKFYFDPRAGDKNRIRLDLPGSFRDVNYFDLTKKKFISESFYNEKYYKFIDGMMIVPTEKNNRIQFIIMREDLQVVVPGAFNSIHIDTVYKKIILYKNYTAFCYDYIGNELFSIEEADTLLPVSQTTYFVEKISGCGIWSDANKKYIIEPNFKSVNYTIPSAYVLLDSSNHYIITDSNGVYSSNDIYKKTSLEHEELTYLEGPFREITQLEAPLFISEEYVYCGESRRHSALRFLLLTNYQESMLRGASYNYNATLYKKDDYELKLMQYIASVCYIIAEKDNGEIYIINGLGKKMLLGKNRVYIFKFGNLVFSQEGNEINGRMRNSGIFNCKGMNGLNLPALSFDEISERFYANGQMNMVIMSRVNKTAKKGVLTESGKLLLPIEYDDIDRHGIEGWGSFIAYNYKGSLIYVKNKLVFKTTNGLVISQWCVTWGMIQNYSSYKAGQANSTGGINNKGKIIIPLKYDIDQWYNNGLIPVGLLRETDGVLLGYYDVNGNKYFE